MNKLSTVVIALALALTITACKKKADQPAGDKPAGDKVTGDKPVTPPPPPPAAAKLAPLDLSAVGEDWKGWTITAPEGATAKDSFGAAEVAAGATFQLDLRSSKGDVAGFKKEIAANDMNKVKQFLVDTADALIYESEVMGQNEFHLYGNVKVGDKEVNCEDVKGPRYMQADVEAMWKACTSLAKK